MARIAGIDLPREKRVEIGLTYIFGIGVTTAKKILADTGINPDTRVKDLTESEVAQLRDYIENNLKVEGAGFGVDTNVMTLITANDCVELPLMSKEAVALAILDKAVELAKTV